VSTNLTNDKDVFIWNLQNSGIFSVHSLYTSITQCGVVPSKCNLWNIKVPLKILKNYGIFGKGSLSQRIILQKEIGKVVSNVVSVVP
jgi:hypothetical protein